MKKTSFKESPVTDILKEKYSNDTILLIATAKDNVPTVRSVDSFYYDGSFWIVTDLNCNYVKEIQSNQHVMISDGGHNRFWCNAKVTGHPLDESNKSIREVFIKVFHHWYKEVNNEELNSVCYVKATPYKGYIHKDKLGYLFNISEDTVSIKDITHHIDVKLEPFW
ncbi:pyridoxamine 5'-phosphate oxidase family protein [Mycoplasmatota bacterium WC44]